MLFQIHIDERQLQINIPPYVLEDGGEFFDKMDQDMDKGWMMSREWVENPNLTQRCQIAADRIADSMHSENETLTYLMAGYILTRMQNVKEVHIDTEGDITETQFITA